VGGISWYSSGSDRYLLLEGGISWYSSGSDTCCWWEEFPGIGVGVILVAGGRNFLVQQWE